MEIAKEVYYYDNHNNKKGLLKSQIHKIISKFQSNNHINNILD